jgi:repressor LexA
MARFVMLLTYTFLTLNLHSTYNPLRLRERNPQMPKNSNVTDATPNSKRSIARHTKMESPSNHITPDHRSFNDSVAQGLADASTQPLSPKEKKVLEFIELYMRENGVAPTYQEVSTNFGFASLNSVQRYLKQLELKNYIKMPAANQKRGLSILRPASSLQDSLMPAVGIIRNESLTIPLLGRVAAGAPIEALEHDEFIEVPSSLVRKADRTYALRVQGQSMIDDGIFDGDFILVQKQSTASNGEIVVAVVGEEATVKRFYRHDQQIELRPANSSMKPMWYTRGDVNIRGVVVGLIRKFW